MRFREAMEPSPRRGSREQAEIASREPNLAELRRLAEDTARERGQKPTTTHLLAALAGGHDEAAQLLLERRLDPEVILRAARVTTDDAPDGLARAIQKARELAGRTGAGRTEARAIHLLFALCQETKTAAHRALVQCGTDVTRLRVASMQLAMGLAPPRRSVSVSAVSASPAPKARTTVTPLTPPSTPPPPSGTRPSGIVPVAPLVRPPVEQRIPVAKPPAPVVAPPAQKIAPPKDAPKAKRPTKESKPSTGGAKFGLDPKQFPLLSQIGRNLTELAARGELDPVVGRDAEIERVLDVLAKRERSNACLLGAPGVGKTSVARGLAQRIADGVDVACFEESIVIGIEPAALLAGTGIRGSLAERIAQLKGEIAKAKGRVVVFFDEIHVLFG
ncbi:MAG TPA: AAA family ATPase, partial [Labilithrix sp.]|nr:AAA family ATPase [Labilithrix sp.]